MDNKPEVHINQSALLQQMADKIIVDFMSALMPDEQTRKIMLATISIHRKYGIDAATSIKIMQELAEITTKEGSND